METIISYLKKHPNIPGLTISPNINLKKIGSQGKQTGFNGYTLNNIVKRTNAVVNLLVLTSPIEMYLVYYNSPSVDTATSECLIQVSLKDGRLVLSESINGHSLIKEYAAKESNSCKDILNIFTRSTVNDIVYNLKLKQHNIPVRKGSIIDEINGILANLSTDKKDKTSTLVNLATVIVQDQKTKDLAKELITLGTAAASDSAIKVLNDSSKGKAALDAYNILASNPFIKQIASTAADMATAAAKEELSKTEKGKSLLDTAASFASLFNKQGGSTESDEVKKYSDDHILDSKKYYVKLHELKKYY
jgi:hypothetical protein